MNSMKPGFPTAFSMPCREHVIDIGKKTYIMGILNVTPDSFSDGGDHNDISEAVLHALSMVKEGADLIDIGGESTRPGGEEVSALEELRRVIPVIEALVKHPEVTVPISIDTYKAEVARAALLAGAHMINDVWGFQKDAGIAKVAAEFDVPSVVMHNQIGTHYDGDIMESMITFFKKTIELAESAGLSRNRLILDPGIGFGKTVEQNIEVMGRLSELSVLGLPILLGTSRKSMIGKILDLPPKERVEGTVATNVLGVAQGVDFIRVHDIQAHVRAIKVVDAILRER